MEVGRDPGQATVGEPLHPVGQVQSADRLQPRPHRQDGNLPVALERLGDGGQVPGRVPIEGQQAGGNGRPSQALSSSARTMAGGLATTASS